jgi:hypothetical protein
MFVDFYVVSLFLHILIHGKSEAGHLRSHRYASLALHLTQMASSKLETASEILLDGTTPGSQLRSFEVES